MIPRSCELLGLAAGAGLMFVTAMLVKIYLICLGKSVDREQLRFQAATEFGGTSSAAIISRKKAFSHLSRREKL